MHVAAAEPYLPDTLSDRLESLAVELPLAAGQFSGRLAPRVRLVVGELVRSMNCYYSNLIEGHDTHPHDIDRALAADYSANPEKRALQLEARAHIEVQRMIDGGQAPNASPLSLDYILWTHREFCSRLPQELLWVEDPKTKEKLQVIPGELRTRMVERTGQRITKSLIEKGYLQSEGHAGALLFTIPSAARDRWFPSLYTNLPAAVH